MTTTTRARTIQQTGELKSADEMMQRYHAYAEQHLIEIDPVEIEIDHKSGFVVYFTIEGKPYTALAACECPAEDFTLFNTPSRFDKIGEHSVTLVCRRDGKRSSIGQLVDQRKRSAAERAIFGPAEERFHNDTRDGWGTYGGHHAR